jgi:hypothetical protein
MYVPRTTYGPETLRFHIEIFLGRLSRQQLLLMRYPDLGEPEDPGWETELYQLGKIWDVFFYQSLLHTHSPGIFRARISQAKVTDAKRPTIP